MVIVESGWGSMLPTVVIANLAPAGAAARCGQLNIGDQIIAINGVSLVGLPLSTCQNYIKVLYFNDERARRDIRSVRSHLFFPLERLHSKVQHCPPKLIVFYLLLSLCFSSSFSLPSSRVKDFTPFKIVFTLLWIVVRLGLFIRRLLISCSLASSSILVNFRVPPGPLTMIRCIS